MLNIKQPYNFSLSLSAVDSFGSESRAESPCLKLPVSIETTPTLLEICQEREDPRKWVVSTSPRVDPRTAEKTAEWILFAAMELLPFYRLAENDTHLKPIIQSLWGVKPMRPASLFEMAVIAITEQQISLAAAYRIRERMVKRFGHQVDQMWVFPTPAALAGVTVEDLRTCGLTWRKSEYISGLAKRVMAGSIDFEKMVDLDDDSVREILLGIRGFGRWSADYVLVRGLARPDCLPVDDIAIQKIAGKILGGGQRFSAPALQQAMLPFAPYRGLAAFYMLAYDKLSHFNPAALEANETQHPIHPGGLRPSPADGDDRHPNRDNSIAAQRH